MATLITIIAGLNILSIFDNKPVFWKENRLRSGTGVKYE